MHLAGQLLVPSQAEVLVIKVLVDDADHALLAVLAVGLGAVEPDGVLGVDNELEDAVGFPLVSGKEEAREEAGAVAKGLARVGKAGLHHAVVGRHELPLDHVANVRDNVVRLEFELACEAGDDRVCYARLGDGARGEVGGCGGGSGHGSCGQEGDGEELGEHDG